MSNDSPRLLWLKWLMWSLVFSLICFYSLGFYLNRDVNWDWPVISGVLSKYSVIAVIVWLLVVAIGSMSRSSSTVLSTIFGYFKQKITGIRPQTPLEKLQEEFESQHPGRLNKEEPLVPVIPPPRDDNPYSYR